MCEYPELVIQGDWPQLARLTGVYTDAKRLQDLATRVIHRQLSNAVLNERGLQQLLAELHRTDGGHAPSAAVPLGALPPTDLGRPGPLPLPLGQLPPGCQSATIDHAQPACGTPLVSEADSDEFGRAEPEDDAGAAGDGSEGGADGDEGAAGAAGDEEEPADRLLPRWLPGQGLWQRLVGSPPRAPPAAAPAPARASAAAPAAARRARAAAPAAARARAAAQATRAPSAAPPRTGPGSKGGRPPPLKRTREEKAELSEARKLAREDRRNQKRRENTAAAGGKPRKRRRE